MVSYDIFHVLSCSDSGYVATQAVPALEQVNLSRGAPPVDCI